MPRAWTELDLFEVWRRILGIVCTIYALVAISQSLLRWRGQYLAEHGRVGRLARLLGIRLQRHGPDLLHIAGLILILAGLLYAHKWVLPHAG